MIDLDDVEVFVITCGDRPSFPFALQHAQVQVPAVPVHVIRDVAPMSAAFQRMLTGGGDRPYFVQVDDDMMLEPDAVARLVRLITDAPSNTAIAALWLWDVHLARAIMGCKIYRRVAIVEAGGWHDVQSCEMAQVERLLIHGWQLHVPWAENMRPGHPFVVGEHDPMFTPETAFERYRDLTLKHRRLGAPLDWVDSVAPLMARRLRNARSDSPRGQVDLAALAGCVAGAVVDLDAHAGEKDFLQRPWHDEWARVAKVLGLTEDS